MRKRTSIDALFPKTRQLVLSALVMHPNRQWTLSELARFLETTPSSLQRELESLVSGEIILRQRQDKRILYSINQANPIYSDLNGLIIKTIGLVEVVRASLKGQIRRIENAFIYGSFAKGDAVSESDVDLMVIGAIGLVDLASAIRKLEDRLERQVNPTVYSKTEFETKVAESDSFIMDVLRGETIDVVGKIDEIRKMVDS